MFNVKLPRTARGKTALNYGPVGGENKRDLSTRLNPNQAANIRNYFVTGDGRLKTRAGLTKYEEVAGTITPSMIEQLNDDHLLYAYDDETNSKLAIYKLSTDTSLVVKTFTSRDDVSGVKVDDLFFACDGTDKIGSTSAGGFLGYTGTFSAGETITGATSGATGVVSSILSGDSKLVLSTSTGTFQAENISGDKGGTGTATGAQTYWFELTNSVPAKKMCLYNTYNGSFLMTGNNTNSSSQIYWAQADTDPTKIPFQTWTVAIPPDPAGANTNLFRGGGQLNQLVAHKDLVVAFYNDATAAFRLEVINVGSADLKQIQVNTHQEFNFGGFNAISTPYGVFYTNENGIYHATFPSGNKIEAEISNILGEDLMEDIDFTDSDLQWDGKTRIYVFCKKDNDYNDFVLVYDLSLKIWTEITGWNIRRACRIATGNKNEIYGVSSRDGSIYKLLEGFTDDGNVIEGRILFRREDNGDPASLNDINHFWLQGDLSPSSLLKIDFHTWDKNNNITEDAKTYWWAGTEKSDPFGYGVTSMGKGTYFDEIFVSPDFVHKGRKPIKNVLGYQVEITQSYDVEHEIHSLEIETSEKRRVKLNNILTANPS